MVKQFIVYNVTGETDIGEVDRGGEYVLFEDYESLRLVLVEFIQRLDPERRFVEDDDLLGLRDHIRCILEQKDEGTLCS